MTVEDRISSALREGLDRIQVSPGDPLAALGSGDSLRHRRRSARVVAAIAVVSVVAAISAVIGTRDSAVEPAPAPTVGSWSELPAPALSPRAGSLAVWTGQVAIFLGGQTEAFCPPSGDCASPPTYARDGAAYDPSTGQWHAIADAPVPVASYTPRVVVDGLLVIVDDDGGWHAYDPHADAWRSLPDPPSRTEASYAASISATGSSVYALGRGDVVLVLDVTEETWSTLPASSARPHLDQVTLQATPEGIVLLGVDATAGNDGTAPSYLLADVFRDGAWHRAERSDMMGGYGWHWTGERLVSPTPTCVDGGEVNPFPGCIPEGGTFDPATGVWGGLPPAPDIGGGTSWQLTAQGGPRMLSYGLTYDDAARAWYSVGAPRGAESLMDAAAVVTDDAVIAFGGVEFGEGEEFVLGARATSRAWTWHGTS
jgi:hypothetical protein